MKRLISASLACLVFLSVMTFASCENKNRSAIEKIEFFRRSDYRLTVGESDTEYVHVTADGPVEDGGVIFVSENKDVAEISAVSYSTALVSYCIKAVSVGETYVYAVSADGLVFSEKLKVTVYDEATTESKSTTEVTEESSAETTMESTEAETVTEAVLDDPETETDTTEATESTTEEATEAVTEAITSEATEATTVQTTEASETTTKEATTSDPEEVIYVLNTSSKKIHRVSCYAVAKIKDENRGESTDIDGLLASGYEWCKICK